MVSLEIFNSLGQRVATVIDAFQEAGKYQVKVDGTRFEQGLYSIIFRLSSREGVMSRSVKCIMNH